MPNAHSTSPSSAEFPADVLSISQLNVTLEGTPVGTLAQTPEGPVAFAYHESWLAAGFALNPLSLPLESRLFIAKSHPLEGLFGVFDDSLPDGWGRLLVDRMLTSHGIDPYSVSPLSRLAIVGNSGMGALEYQPAISLMPAAQIRNLDELASDCADLLRSNYSKDLDTLFAMGGSSGGARPKVFVEIDGEDWIVKFPSSHDPEDIGSREFAIAQTAEACGIEMPETRLMPSKTCQGYFAIKRFDRRVDVSGSRRKIHMASAGALLETSHRIPNLDYGLLMKLTLRLTESLEDVERLFKLMVFNVAIGNRDDHAKNFSFLRNDFGWSLSPAYDLTQNSGMNGEHATTVNGKGKNISADDLEQVGKRAGLSPKAIRTAIAQVEEAVSQSLSAWAQLRP